MTDVPATTNGARGALSWLLLFLAAATLVAAVVVSWAHGVLFDPAGFRAVAAGALEGEGRAALIERVLEAAFRDDPPAGRAASTALVDEVTGDAAWERIQARTDFDAAIAQAHAALLEPEGQAVQIDGAGVRDVLLEAARREGDEGWSKTLRDTPTPFPVTLVEASALPSLGVHDGAASTAPFLLLGVSLILAFLGVRGAPERGAAAGHFVLLVALLAFLAMLLTAATASGVIPSTVMVSGDGALPVLVARAFAASLRDRLMIVAVAGGLMLLLRWRVLTNAKEAGA